MESTSEPNEMANGAEPKPANARRTHAEFLQSLRDAQANGRPISYFRQWPSEYLVEAGLPAEWLEKCGLIQPDGVAKIPNQSSQRQFAEIVSRRYGKPITQAAVSRAIKDGLNVAVTPSNGRLKTDAALRWWEQQKAGAGGSGVATEYEDKAARQRIARRREELELEERERQLSNKWISLAVAESHAAGWSRRYHGLWTSRNEGEMIEAFVATAQSLNIDPEKIALLKQFLTLEHQKFTDAVEVACEKFAGELMEKLKIETSKKNHEHR